MMERPCIVVTAAESSAVGYDVWYADIDGSSYLIGREPSFESAVAPYIGGALPVYG